jgi:hypothetical protein
VAVHAAASDCLLYFSTGDVERFASTIEKNFVVKKFKIGIARLQAFTPVAHEVRRHFAINVKHLHGCERFPVAKFSAC